MLASTLCSSQLLDVVIWLLSKQHALHSLLNHPQVLKAYMLADIHGGH